MSQEIVNSVIGFIVGTVVTTACTNWLNSRQEMRSSNSKFKLFATSILVDLEQSVNLYEKLVTYWQKGTIIIYEYTAELKEYRLTYERYTEHVLQFSADLRDKIIRYYAKTKWLIFCLESDQRRREELLRTYQNIIKNLKNNQPDIKEESSKILASKLTKDEDFEFSMLNEKINNQIIKLIEFKKEAQLIMEQIKNESS